MSPLRKESLAVNQALALNALMRAITEGIHDDRADCPACQSPICDQRMVVSIQNEMHEHNGKIVCTQCATPRMGITVKTKSVLKQALPLTVMA